MTVPGDQVAFFAADLGHTRTLAVTNASAALTERLSPGRYFIQVVPADGAGTLWVRVGPFITGTPVVAVAADGKQRMPFASIGSFEFNVRKDYNDGFAAIATSGSGTIYVTKASRDA